MSTTDDKLAIIELQRVELQHGVFRRREVAAEVRTCTDEPRAAIDLCDVAADSRADGNHDAVVRIHWLDH